MGWTRALSAVVLTTSLAIGTAACQAESKPGIRIRLPERLMTGTEILRELYLQGGQSYAYPSGAIIRQLDATEFRGEATADVLARKLADTVALAGDVLVLEADLGDAALKALTDKLASAQVDERRVAAYLLGCARSTKVIGPLFAAVRDKDESARHHALRSLERLERDFRRHHPPGRVSVFELAAPASEKSLEALLRSAPDQTSHQWIWTAELIGRRGRPVRLDDLTKGSTHGYSGTRQAARWALSRLTRRPAPGRGSPGDLRGSAGLAELGRQLKDENPATRAAAVRTLARRNDLGADGLLQALGGEKDTAVRAEILLALGRKGGKQVWTLLLKELTHSEPTIRRAAIRALRRCPDPRAVKPLMDILTGPDHPGHDRNLAAMSLGLIGTDGVVNALTEYVNKTSKPVSTTSLALGWTQDRRAVAPLIKCLGVKSDALKTYAFTALARLGTPEAVDAIAGSYNQYDNTARYTGHAAARLAGRVQDAVDRYTEIIKAGRGKIAAHGLEMAEDPRAVDALIQALPGSKGSRLMWVTQSLGRIGDPKAVPALVAAMDRPEPWARYEAMRALRWRWYWRRADVRAAFKKHPVFRALVKPPPSLANQPENTWVCRAWAIDFDDHRVANTTYEAGLTFDESTGKVLKWGSHGQRCDTPQSGETWLYDPAANSWAESNSPVHPFGMCGTWGVAYDKANRCAVSVQAMGADHGWQWRHARTLRPSSPWVYYGQQDRWEPAARLEAKYGPGMRGFHKLVYHDRAQVVFLYGGQGGNFRSKANTDRGWVYDAYSNTWALLPKSDPLPGTRTVPGMCYLAHLDRVLMVGGSYGKAEKRVTWLYDLATNTWTDAKAKGRIPVFRLPVVYDPVTQTALKFAAESDGTHLWQYDPKANAWSKVPDAPGPTPHHGSVDVAYDPVHNVFIMDGGHINWDSDHIGVREVWTYKFKKRDRSTKPGRLPAPTGVTLRTTAKQIAISWKPVRGAAGYRVYADTAEATWKCRFAPAHKGLVKTTRFSNEAPAGEKGVVFCYVVAVDAKGNEGDRSPIVRAQPPLVHGVVVSTMPDRTVHVRWDKSDAPDVAGYHVYASRVEIGEYHPRDVFRKIRPLRRLTDKPVTATEFADTRKLAETEGLFSHEIRAYEVRAVNAIGVESGPSAVVMTLTSSVPRVTATEQSDGSTLIAWDAVPGRAVRGYRVYRMDDFRVSLIVRLNPHPVGDTRHVDWCEAPRAERRRYYVVAVDALGQEGTPSTGAWAFGRP